MSKCLAQQDFRAIAWGGVVRSFQEKAIIWNLGDQDKKGGMTKFGEASSKRFAGRSIRKKSGGTQKGRISRWKRPLLRGGAK